MTVRSGLSRRGASIRGDDYQHLAGWVQVAQALQQGSDVERIGIEDPDRVGADDVTVYRRLGRNTFVQAKSAVDARRDASVSWLCEPSTRGGPSTLQKLYAEWSKASPDQRPELVLLTNRHADQGDPVLRLRDGRDGTVAVRLAAAPPQSDAGSERRQLAEHLGIGEDLLLKFLRDFRPVLGRLDADLRQDARQAMGAAGLRIDDEAIRAGIDFVHDWVVSGEHRVRSIDDVRKAVDALGLRSHDASRTLLLYAIDRDTVPPHGCIVLDWVDDFIGEQPRHRRRPRDVEVWRRFRDDLNGAARVLREEGHRSVLVEGYARLPTWFAAGVALSRTANFAVASIQGSEVWSSTSTPADFPIATAETALGSGEELAVSIGVAVDPTEDVLHSLTGMTDVGRHILLTPESGPSNTVIRSGAEALGCAFALRDQARTLCRTHRPRKVHLYLAAPRGVALLLGHLWDRLPETQLYEDLAADGYLPSFVV